MAVARPLAARLSPRDLNRATLARQGLLARRHLSVADAVAAFGALQSQHPEWPPISLGARLDGFDQDQLTTAFENHAIVRAGLMRITQHTVVRDDFWPMWTITQPFRLAQWRAMNMRDPLDPALLRRLEPAYAAAVDALRAEPLRREQFTTVLKRHAPPDLRDLPYRGLSRHFMAVEPLVQVPMRGEIYGRAAYALADAWAGPAPEHPEPDGARAAILRRYLAAFGPATVADAAAWVGRGRGGVAPWHRALEALGDDIVELEGPDGARLYDLADAPRPDGGTPAPPRLLARWDSILLAHAVGARTRILAGEHHARVNLRNADVLPTILVDGFVAGTWEPMGRQDPARVVLRPFGRVPRPAREALESEAEAAMRILAPHAVNYAVTWE